MSPAVIRARIDTAWAIAKASDPVVRALLLLVPDEHAYMLWAHGYAIGANAAYDRAIEIASRQV